MARGLNPRTFLLLGLLAGLIAGIAAFGVAWLVGEQHVDAAIALEEAAAHTHSHGDEEAPLVTRTVQSTIGLLTGTLVIGTVLGGITALVAALAMGRLGALRPATSTAVVTLLGFISVTLVPFLKYPANPPAVGDPSTINQRTAYFFAFLALAIIAVVAGVLLARQLSVTYGGYAGVVAGTALALAIVVVAAVLLPTVDEVKDDFPASLLWNFRISALLALATLWGVLGVVLTGLVRRVDDRVRADAQRRELAASL